MAWRSLKCTFLNYDTLGKFHVPIPFAYAVNSRTRRVISYNKWDFNVQTPGFDNGFNWKNIYVKAKDSLLKRDGKTSICNTYGAKQQENTFSKCPYTVSSTFAFSLFECCVA